MDRDTTCTFILSSCLRNRTCSTPYATRTSDGGRHANAECVDALGCLSLASIATTLATPQDPTTANIDLAAVAASILHTSASISVYIPCDTCKQNQLRTLHQSRSSIFVLCSSTCQCLARISYSILGTKDRDQKSASTPWLYQILLAFLGLTPAELSVVIIGQVGLRITSYGLRATGYHHLLAGNWRFISHLPATSTSKVNLPRQS